MACMLNPEKVALGAPEGEADDGLALVIMQSPSTTDANDQSSPTRSCSMMSKRVPRRASDVSRAARSPIAFTVIENVIDLGEYTAPTWVASIECTGSTPSEK